MSAIGSVVIVRRDAFAKCVLLASAVRTERKGWGPFKKVVTHGQDTFDKAWEAAVIDERDFAYSGYVLGNYLDAQRAISGLATKELEESDAARALCKVFTAAMPFEKVIPLPELPQQALHDFCVAEYRADADGMVTAIQAADAFYRSTLERVSIDQIAVFIIS
jgi:hypothetical protein